MQLRTETPPTAAYMPWHFLTREWRLALGLVVFYELALLLLGLLMPNVAYCPELAQGAIEQTLLRPWLRYDVCHYIIIARDGYGASPGSTAFHPLYPLLMSAAGRLLGGQYLLGGWLVSAVCCTAMLALLYKLALLDYDADVAQRSVLFLLASPLGFAFLIPYTEALLLLCIVGALYAARRGRWAWAGLAGFGAALTKQPGVVVLLPLVWELWRLQIADCRLQIVGRRITLVRRTAASTSAICNLQSAICNLAWLALTPFGLLVFVLFRASLGDVAFAWNNPISLVDTLLVTPQYREVWAEYFSWPWVNFLLALEVIATRPYFYIVLNTALMLVAVALIIVGARRWRPSYTLFSLAITLLNLSIVYPLWPYMGIVRRFTIVFPIFFQLALWGRRPGARLLILVLSGGLWLLVVLMFLRKAFVP